MAQDQFQRPSLGQWADLGALYDARTDIFVSRSILPSQWSEASLNTTPTPSRQSKILNRDSYNGKLADLGVGIELGASFLSGMINVAGAAEYLKHHSPSHLCEQRSISYTVITVEERLNFASYELRPFIKLDQIHGSGATHVLAAIAWGGQSIMTIRRQLGNESERGQVSSQLEDICRRVEDATHSGVNTDNGFQLKHDDHQGIFGLAVYSDVVPEPGQPPDLKHAVEFITDLPSRVAELYGGKGMPRTYTLVPLGLLSFMLSTGVRADATVTQPALTHLESYQAFFDELRNNARRLYDYHQELIQHKHCVAPQFIDSVMNSLQRLTAAESTVRPRYGQLLRDIRCDQAHQTQLLTLLETTRLDFACSKDITDMTGRHHGKITFVNEAMRSGINYLGYGASPLEAELSRHGIEDAYVLFFNEKTRRESASWDQNYRLLQQLLKEGLPERMVALVDCDATGQHLEREYISRYQNSKVVVPDVLDQMINGQCFARYIDESQLDRTDAQKPLRRSAVKISCPGPRCNVGVAHDWVCPECNVPIEYGPLDQYMYCDCGRSRCTNYGFKCKELEHGGLYERYDKSMLLKLLDSLDPLDELNILIIGETGVGKSTFINAFVNYLSHNTLDDAMNTEHLDSVIPCSFTVQSMDRSDPTGAIAEQRIKVGDDAEEVDGSQGESATQKTTVYPVTYGDTVVRLIDTPGIGDTRGFDMDKKNMANILSMLRYFDKLHGILFLLKSNSSRLTFMFRFVMEELLTHLHRDAALNMVFGFTNTRISNYMPGDTYGPLKTLLEKHKQVDLALSPRTIYCFDSESFRFLAAQKNGVTMENLQDFRLSWDKSEKETKRLIEHFRSLSPHFVRSTLSLNQTRELILQLTRPMADIMQEIDATIQLNVDNIRDLEDTRLRGDKLRGRLKWEKKELETQPLDKPRTVCNDTACKQFEDDGSGNKKPIYNSMCHKECYLKNVPAETLSCPELKRCAAFGGHEECLQCSHRWENHLHIYYELTEVLKQVDDEAVIKLLAKNASDIALKEAAIENLKQKIREADYEYTEIQDAAVRFGLFLKKNSITPYNDAMLAYLDHLIKEEVDKVEIAGGKRERLDNLLRHRREHIQQVMVLSQSMASGDGKEIFDEAGVEALVDHLYRLKHWGKNLRDTKDRAEAAHLQACYRERPYRPQGRGGGGRGPVNNRGGFVSGAVTSAINYFAGNAGGNKSLVIAEKPRRPAMAAATAAVAATATTTARPRPPSFAQRPHEPERIPGASPSSAPTRNTSTHQGNRQVLRKPQPITGQQAYTPRIDISQLRIPEPPTKPASLKSRLLRPFSKRF